MDSYKTLPVGTGRSHLSTNNTPLENLKFFFKAIKRYVIELIKTHKTNFSEYSKIKVLTNSIYLQNESYRSSFQRNETRNFCL